MNGNSLSHEQKLISQGGDDAEGDTLVRHLPALYALPVLWILSWDLLAKGFFLMECPERRTDSSAPTRMLSTARKSTLEAQDKAPSAGPRVGPSCIVEPTSSREHPSFTESNIPEARNSRKPAYRPTWCHGCARRWGSANPPAWRSLTFGIRVLVEFKHCPYLELLGAVSRDIRRSKSGDGSVGSYSVISNVQHLNQGTCVTSPVTNEDVAFIRRAPSICGSKSNAEEEGSRFQARMTGYVNPSLDNCIF
ncbi:hypothetical protein C8J56DRAFT_1170105 [Mycena floridula]|nr:hypothetical protein C8J56DRAFT_1170105 [Mycena floridula]